MKGNIKRIKLDIGLQEICDNNKYDQVLFWGRIRGLKSNYYIAMAIKFHGQYEFPAKKFFYSTENFVFKELPQIIAQFKTRIEYFNSELEGNPEKIIWEIEKEEEKEDQISDKNENADNEEINLDETISDSSEEKEKIVIITQMREIDRLAYIIRAIEMDCAIVPVGSFKLTTNHELHYNQNFKGLNLKNALLMKNWMHFRQPLCQEKKKSIEKAEAIFKFDLLEGLENDLPTNCWSIKSDVAEEFVTVRSLVWQGFMGYHRLNENIFGYAYFGNGVKNVEVNLLI